MVKIMWFQTRICYVVALLAFAVYSNPIDPTITAPPSLVHVPRQNPGSSLGSDFWGYSSENGSFVPMLCDSGYTLTLSTPYGDCVSPSATNPDIGTGCRSGSSLLLQSSVSVCSGSLSVCATYLLYRNLDDSAPYSLYGCNTAVLNMQLYLSTTVGPSTTTQAAPPTKPSTAIATSTNPPPNPTPPSQNLAWIAGPVVGGVLGIAIAGGLIWWFGRRKNSTTVHQVSEGDNRRAPTVSELDSKPRKAIPELETKPSHAIGGQAEAHELSGEQNQRIPELDGGQGPVELPTDGFHRHEK